MLLAVIFWACAVVGAVASPQQQQQPVPQCTWFAYDVNVPSAGYCTLDDRFLLSSSFQEPSSFIGKQLTRIYGRQHLCTSANNKTRASCEVLEAKEGLGCYWAESTRLCQALELHEWRWFSRHAYAAETPLSFLCPGSKAAEYKACFGWPKTFGLPKTATCSATKGCTAYPSAQDGGCQPSWWASMSTGDQSRFQWQLAAADSEAMGSCEATCYLRGVYSLKTSVYGGDAWGQAVGAAAMLCSSLSKDRDTCMRGPRAGVVATARVDKYKNYVVEASTAPLKCP